MIRLEQEAKELFGEMREATPQEHQSVKLYITQISKHKSKFDFEEEYENIDSLTKRVLFITCN